MGKNLRKDLNYFAVHLKHNIVNQLLFNKNKLKLPTVNIQKKTYLNIPHLNPVSQAE